MAAGVGTVEPRLLTATVSGGAFAMRFVSRHLDSWRRKLQLPYEGRTKTCR